MKSKQKQTKKFVSITAILVLGLLGIGVFLASGAQAATGVPEIISYQGRLTNSSGALLGGSGTDFVFRFSIWNNPTVPLGLQLWPSGTPGNATTTVVEGVFNVNIGDTSSGTDALTYNFNDNDTVYLQVEVSTDGISFEPLSPRQQITASGFAINANTVGGYTPAQSASGSQIPVLTSGNLVLGGANPQINVTGSYTLTFQSGVTGNIQFFSSANSLTSAGTLTLAGGLNANSATTTDTLAVGGTLRLADGSATFPGFTFANDLNTGIFRSGDDILDISTGGVSRLTITTATSTFATSIVADSTTFIVNANENRVGIGTVSPTSTLAVVGDTRLNGAVNITGTLTLGLNCSGMSNNGTLTADASGQVFCDPDAGGGASTGDPGAWNQLWAGASPALTPTDTTAGIFVRASSTFDSTLRINGALSALANATSTFADGAVFDTNTLVINANENRVGIGTATPTTT
ncbi:MAG: hypothetical protein HY396_01020, partial [Candidatus Doudnabacteria bacterium]|nr:hypothetical protein [Candidatus Doudnabacteria bacterium]